MDCPGPKVGIGMFLKPSTANCQRINGDQKIHRIFRTSHCERKISIDILILEVYRRVVTLATQLPSRLREASKLYCFPQIFQSSLVDTSLGLAFQQKKVSEVNSSITSTDLAAPPRRNPDGSRRPALKHGGFTTNFATSGSIILKLKRNLPGDSKFDSEFYVRLNLWHL